MQKLLKNLPHGVESETIAILRQKSKKPLDISNLLRYITDRRPGTAPINSVSTPVLGLQLIRASALSYRDRALFLRPAVIKSRERVMHSARGYQYGVGMGEPLQNHAPRHHGKPLTSAARCDILAEE